MIIKQTYLKQKGPNTQLTVEAEQNLDLKKKGNFLLCVDFDVQISVSINLAIHTPFAVENKLHGVLKYFLVFALNIIVNLTIPRDHFLNLAFGAVFYLALFLRK